MAAAAPRLQSRGDWNWTSNVEPYLLSGRSEVGARCVADVQSGKLQVPPSCAAQPAGAAFCCMGPPLAYAYSTTPMFISENTADAYQVYASGLCPAQAKSCAASVLNTKATAFCIAAATRTLVFPPALD